MKWRSNLRFKSSTIPAAHWIWLREIKVSNGFSKHLCRNLDFQNDYFNLAWQWHTKLYIPAVSINTVNSFLWLTMYWATIELQCLNRWLLKEEIVIPKRFKFQWGSIAMIEIPISIVEPIALIAGCREWKSLFGLLRLI